jgi:hypothetical protein
VKPVPLSAHWQREIVSFDNRKPPKPAEGIKLNDTGTAAIKLDEEGKPRLFLGDNSRVSADLEADSHGAEVRVKMKRKWDRGRAARE